MVSSLPLLLQPCNQQGHVSFSVAVLPLFRLSCKISRIFRQETKNTRVPTLGTLVQRITPPCSVAAGCAVLWTSNRLSAPARKKCIFSRKKFVQPVRSVLVRTRTANRSKLKRVIVCILHFRTPYRPYGLFEVRTQFFQMRTEPSSSHNENMIATLPQETFPLGESSKSPLHFADRRDESVIVGYYTSSEVHLRSPVTFLSPERRDALWQEMMASTAQASEISPFRTRLLATPSSTMNAKRTAIGTPTFFPTTPNGTSISRSLPPATLTCSPNWKPLEPFPRAA